MDIHLPPKKPAITLIAAVAKNDVIGCNNQLPWHIPEDLAFFKKTTMNHVIAMGKNTWLSLKAPLTGRKNVVISTTLSPTTDQDIHVYHSLSLFMQEHQDIPKIFIIGGASLYEQFLPVADELLVTRIEADYPGDCFFPAICPTHWHLTESIPGSSTHYPHPFYFERYTKK